MASFPFKDNLSSLFCRVFGIGALGMSSKLRTHIDKHNGVTGKAAGRGGNTYPWHRESLCLVVSD